jgi:hypothetical protein
MTVLQDVTYIVDVATEDVQQAQTSITEATDEAAKALTMARNHLGRHTVEPLAQAEAEIKAAADKVAAILGDLERARGLVQAVAGAT